MKQAVKTASNINAFSIDVKLGRFINHACNASANVKIFLREKDSHSVYNGRESGFSSNGRR